MSPARPVTRTRLLRKASQLFSFADDHNALGNDAIARAISRILGTGSHFASKWGDQLLLLGRTQAPPSAVNGCDP
jgi:hypothetical protein